MSTDSGRAQEQSRFQFRPNPEWRPGEHPPAREAAPTIVPQMSVDTREPGIDELTWEYQWEDSLNALSERAVSPHLAVRLGQELARAAVAGSPATIFVRGELGIGKTTLRRMLTDGQLEAMARAYDDQDQPSIKNALLTCEVLEALDLESPVDFAGRINRLGESTSIIGLARPGTLDEAAQWVHRRPTVVVTMNPFEPTRPTFRLCVEEVARVKRMAESKVDLLAELAGRLPTFMCTPFYFGVLADYVVDVNGVDDVLTKSPLELLQKSLERRLGRDAYEDMVACAIGDGLTREVDPVPGILRENGHFVHDGYRSVLLAGAVLAGTLPFRDVPKLPNAIPAIRTLLNHVEMLGRSGNRRMTMLVNELENFVTDEVDIAGTRYRIFVQGLVATSLRKLRRDAAAEVLRARCMQLIADIDVTPDSATADHESSLLWDVSDALSMVNDPRLRRARAERHSRDSGYFSFVPRGSVVIGSEHVPDRLDAAKPVLPYFRQVLETGGFWVANFLVTNELYREFWASSQRSQHFFATGRQWVSDDDELMEAIEKSFDVTSRRCFWKEASDERSAAIIGLGAGTLSILDIAKMRALRQGRVALWDPTQADDRFSANGSPVVGVTWWEAMAFCRWWQSTKLHGSGFPSGSSVSLLTDWEWEAVRRMYYDGVDFPDTPMAEPWRFGAHLRSPTQSPDADVSRFNNVARPLHVGLFRTPAGEGPLDLIGNVWEWTRSRVYGSIVWSEEEHPHFGRTLWTDGDVEGERTAIGPLRDTTLELNDLSYRAVRGASFFSMDDQAAWNPSYRLCDPPYSSYFDLGFRIAVYPPDYNVTG